MVSKRNKFLSVVSVVMSAGILSGCASTNVAKAPPPKAVLVYVSDSTSASTQFFQTATNKIRSTDLFQVTVDPSVSETWVDSYLSGKTLVPASRILTLANSVRDAYQMDSLRHAKEKSRHAQYDAERALEHVSSPAAADYATLAFWSAVANYDSPREQAFPAALYVTLSTPQQRANLEAQTSPKIVADIYKQAAKLKPVYVKLQGNNSCTVYVNGKTITGNAFLVPEGGHSIVSAQCTDGEYHTAFNPRYIKVINVTPERKIVTTPPAIADLPVNQIKSLNVDAAITIYYNTRNKYVEANVYSVPENKFYSTLHFDLKKPAQVKNADAILAAYLKDAETKLQVAKSTAGSTTRTAQQ